MSSKRALRRKKCEGKAAHKSHHDAMIAVFKMYRKLQIDDIQKFDVYKCEFCKQYHIGRRRRKYL